MTNLIPSNVKLDAEDRKTLESMGKWRICPDTGYLVRTHRRADGKRGTIYAHRIIMQPAPGLVVDHINHNLLDLRRESLRIVEPFMNSQNKKNRPTLAYENGNGYSAYFTWNKERVYMGQYPTLSEASEASWSEKTKRMNEYTTQKKG